MGSIISIIRGFTIKNIWWQLQHEKNTLLQIEAYRVLNVLKEGLDPQVYFVGYLRREHPVMLTVLAYILHCISRHLVLSVYLDRSLKLIHIHTITFVRHLNATSTVITNGFVHASCFHEAQMEGAHTGVYLHLIMYCSPSKLVNRSIRYLHKIRF